MQRGMIPCFQPLGVTGGKAVGLAAVDGGSEPTRFLGAVLRSTSVRLAPARRRRKYPLGGSATGRINTTGEDGMRARTGVVAFSLALTLALSLGVAWAAPFVIVGNDEKLIWDDQGKPILSPPGKDSVLIVDLADPMNPKIVANLALENSVVGPPVNLDISP